MKKMMLKFKKNDIQKNEKKMKWEKWHTWQPDLVPFLTIFVFGMWSCSSFLLLFGLTVTSFWKKCMYITVLEDYHCWKNAQVLKFENSPYHVVLNFWGTE